MFIPRNPKVNTVTKSTLTGKVQLKASHLWIHHEVVEEVFGKDLNVYITYYSERRSLMLAPVSDEIFKKLHKAGQQMLKNRNLQGDKTIALHEILIDNQIDETDRNLDYTWQKGLGILKIQL